MAKKAKTADLETVTPDLEQEADDLEQEADALEQEADALEQEADDLEQEADDLEQEADDLEQEADALEQEAESEDAEDTTIIKAYRTRKKATEARKRATEARNKATEARNKASNREAVQAFQRACKYGNSTPATAAIMALAYTFPERFRNATTKALQRAGIAFLKAQFPDVITPERENSASLNHDRDFYAVHALLAILNGEDPTPLDDCKEWINKRLTGGENAVNARKTKKAESEAETEAE